MLCALLQLLNPELLLLRCFSPFLFLAFFFGRGVFYFLNSLLHYSSMLLQLSSYEPEIFVGSCFRAIQFIMVHFFGLITQMKLSDLERKFKPSDAKVKYPMTIVLRL